MNTIHHTPDSDSSVERLLDRLGDRLPKAVDFAWGHTGGGCYAIEVPLPDEGYLLITDYEGPFTAADGDSDDEIVGWYVGRYDADGNQSEADAGYVYASNVDDEEYTPASDIDDVVDAVVAEVAKAREQERTSALELADTLDAAFGSRREAFAADPGGMIDYHGIDATEQDAVEAIALVLQRWAEGR